MFLSGLVGTVKGLLFHFQGLHLPVDGLGSYLARLTLTKPALAGVYLLARMTARQQGVAGSASGDNRVKSTYGMDRWLRHVRTQVILYLLSCLEGVTCLSNSATSQYYFHGLIVSTTASVCMQSSKTTLVSVRSKQPRPTRTKARRSLMFRNSCDFSCSN